MRNIYVDNPRLALDAIKKLTIRNKEAINFLSINGTNIESIMSDETAEIVPNAEIIQYLKSVLEPDYLPAFNEYVNYIDRLKAANEHSYYVATSAVWRDADGKIVFEW